MPRILEPLLHFTDPHTKLAADAFLALRQLAIATSVYPDRETDYPHTAPSGTPCVDFHSTFKGKGYFARLGLYTSNAEIPRLTLELFRGDGLQGVSSGGVHLKLEPDIDQWVLNVTLDDIPRPLRKALLNSMGIAGTCNLESSAAFRVAHEVFMYIRSIRK